MALRYGYFDSEITGYDDEGMPIFDRAETSDLFALLFANLVSNGVLAQPSDCYQVTAAGGMTLNIAKGFAMVRGHFAYSEESDFVTIPEPPSNDMRIDTIVLRLNAADRLCEIIVKSGEISANPVPPPLDKTLNGDLYELGLADVLVRANTTGITQSAITDTRADSSRCGYITQLIDHLDTEVFMQQLYTLFAEYKQNEQEWEEDRTALFNAWFNIQSTEFFDWFNRMKDQLSTDAAGNLQRQIDNIVPISIEELDEILEGCE